MDTDTVSVDVARAQEETLIDDLCQREATIAMQEQELGLLRKVEQAALCFWHKTGIGSLRGAEDEWDALTDALTDVAFWRDEHAKVTR